MFPLCREVELDSLYLDFAFVRTVSYFQIADRYCVVSVFPIRPKLRPVTICFCFLVLYDCCREGCR
jgi:hypothetical protein